MAIKEILAAFRSKREPVTIAGQVCYLHPFKPDLMQGLREHAEAIARKESSISPSLQARAYVPTEEDKAAWEATDMGAAMWAEWERGGFPKTHYDMAQLGLVTNILSVLIVISQLHTEDGKPLATGITKEKELDATEELAGYIRSHEAVRQELQDAVARLWAKTETGANEFAKLPAKKKNSPKRNTRTGR